MNVAAIQAWLDPWLSFLAADPTLRLLQFCMLLLGALVIFLVFYTTRDILLRTTSFLYMFVCIVLVAAVPVVGFLFYLLIRPPRTIKERELERLLQALVGPEKAEKPKTKKPKTKPDTSSSTK